jgi:hypothetical protein
MALVMTILMLFSSSIPVTCNSNSSTYVISNSTGSFADTHNSLQPTEKQLFFIALSAQLALQEVKPVPKTPGRIQNWQKSLHFLHGTQILFPTNISFFVNKSTRLVGKNNTHIPVIAFSIGGHSPPPIHS